MAEGNEDECEHDTCRSDATETATKASACCGSLSRSQRARLECLARPDTAGWRAPAFSSYAYLRGELERLAPLAGVDEKAARVAERALDEALLGLTDAARTRGRKGRLKLRRPHPWITLKRFYSGSDIEHTWRAIHRAQAAAYLAYPDTELVPQAEHVEAVVKELDGHPELLKSVTTLIAKHPDPPAAAHAAAGTARAQTRLRGIYERTIDVSDNLQAEARGLRNALLIASGTSFVVLLALGFAHVFDHEIVRLCTGSPKACPIGTSPHGLEVFTVELAGMLGGLLSIVIPLAIGERIKTPYRVFFQQLLLKMLVGAATALGGILLIESSVITTIKLGSTTAIIGYSVFFGFAQQVVTGAIDRRADALAKQTPIAKSV